MFKGICRRLALGSILAWRPAIIGAAALSLINLLGWIFGDGIADLVRTISGGALEPIQDGSSIYAIWLGAVGVHAAVGALAPILGYTLITTNTTSASRIAPAGGVIAQEIEWGKYLRLSLALLASSVFGVIFAPSPLGLSAAVLTTCYVVIKTGMVFKQGFDLIERPERYDASARRYLAQVVRSIELEDPSPEQRGMVNLLNEELEAHLQMLPRGTVVQSKLKLGSQFSETELVRYKAGGIEAIRSEAASLGCTLYWLRSPMDCRLARGRFGFMAVVRTEQAAALNEAPQGSGQDLVDDSSIERLQEILEKTIFYQATRETEDLARMPLLVMRHVATVIQEALPGQRPHDIEYGLDVLGQMIDQISESKSHGSRVVNSDRLRWIYRIPAFVSGQLDGVAHSRMIYARLLISFIRNRMILWLNDEGFDPMSEAYMGLLGDILRSSAKSDVAVWSYGIMAIREIPALAKVQRFDAIGILVRELVFTFVGHNLAVADARRPELIKAIDEVLRFGGDVGESARVDTLVVTLAVALYKADEDDFYKNHVAEVSHGLVLRRHEDNSFSDVVSVISNSRRLMERWRLDWWELEEKGSGAHWISMGSWVLRAAVVLLSNFSWRLPYLKDDELPAEDILTAVLKEVENLEWLSLLPDSIANAVRGLHQSIVGMRDRRRNLVEARVIGAAVLVPKVRDFVHKQMSSIKSEFSPYNKWLMDSGSIECGVSSNGIERSGVSRLVPKESFVGDDVVDIPVMMLVDNIGRSLIDFELSAIARALLERVESPIRVDSVSDRRIWDDIDNFSNNGGGALLVLGVGVGFYENYHELSNAKATAESRQKEVRFESVQGDGAMSRAVIIAEPSASFKICRRHLNLEEEAIYREQLPLDEGGVVSDVIEIDESMKARWIEGLEPDAKMDMLRVYERSLVARTFWDFSILVGSANFRVYMLPPVLS